MNADRTDPNVDAADIGGAYTLVAIRGAGLRVKNDRVSR